MNSKQKKILGDIFSEERRSINWDDIEKLMKTLGAIVQGGAGSRVKFIFQEHNRTFACHRPHPQKEAKDYLISELKRFLTEIGVSHGQ